MRTMNSLKTKEPSVLNKDLPELLSTKICDLPLQIQGTWLETLIDRLYRELDEAGISFKPRTYLSGEWGCPQNVPMIGIPFYLADPKLRELEGQMTGVEAETEAEVMMYLRHESGHTFNYAYRLYNKASWQRVFGKYSQSLSGTHQRLSPGGITGRHGVLHFYQPNCRDRLETSGTDSVFKKLQEDRTERAKARKRLIKAAEACDTQPSLSPSSSSADH
jgi:hypothetical protein